MKGQHLHPLGQHQYRGHRLVVGATVMAVLSTLWASRREVAAAVILGGGVLFYINRRMLDER